MDYLDEKEKERKATERILKDYLYMFYLTTAILITIILLNMLFSLTVQAKEIKTYSYSQLANAIYKAEGGKKARKPYGVLSVQCDSEKQCREICINTIRNNAKRWKQKTHNADKYPDYLSFLASRYAPVGVNNDPKNLNKNWLKNVKFFLEKE